MDERFNKQFDEIFQTEDKPVNSVEQQRAEFEEYIQSSYPMADRTHRGDGYASYHIDSLWRLWLHIKL